jgi:hypothetical protein
MIQTATSGNALPLALSVDNGVDVRQRRQCHDFSEISGELGEDREAEVSLLAWLEGARYDDVTVLVRLKVLSQDH